MIKGENKRKRPHADTNNQLEKKLRIRSIKYFTVCSQTVNASVSAAERWNKIPKTELIQRSAFRTVFPAAHRKKTYACLQERIQKRKPPTHCWIGGFSRKRQLPTLPLLRSTIGVTRLNFSVRNGKRWNPRAIATWIRCDMTEVKIKLNEYVKHGKKVNGQLVMLGFDVTTFTPASYQRHRLWRP